MSKTIVDYNIERRQFVSDLKEKDILGLAHGVDNKDILFLMAALGKNNPKELNKKDGWVRVDYISKKVEDKVRSSIFCLGSGLDDTNIDQKMEPETYLSYLEKCAENGFCILQEMLDDVEWDNDRLERRLLLNLEQQYTELFGDAE